MHLPNLHKQEGLDMWKYNQLVSIILCRHARKLDANTGYRCTSRTAVESGRTARSDLITWQQPRSPRPRPALSTPQWNSSAPIDSLNRVINNLNTWSVGGGHYHRKYFIALNIVKRAEGWKLRPTGRGRRVSGLYCARCLAD